MSSTDHLSELESLRSQVADLSGALAERDRSMQDLREQSQLLRTIVEGTAAETGDEFFASLVMHLTSTLHVQYAVIGEVLEGRLKKIRTLAVSAGGALADNFEYELAHTPCATALTQNFACFSQDVQATFPQFQRLAELGVESYCAVPLRTKKGAVIGLLVVMDTKPLPQGDYLQSLLGVFAPRIAAEFERRRAEQERAQALTDLHNVMETVPDVMFTLDRQGNLVKWNRRLGDVTGYSPEELLNKPALAFVPLEEQTNTAAAIQRAFTEGYAELEGQMLTKGLRTIPYHWISAALKDPDGRIIGITGVGRDVSGKKQVEAELRQQQHRLVDAQTLAHLGNWEWELDSGEMQWSDEQYRIFGHEPGAIAVTYDTFLISLHPDENDRVLAAINDALLGKRPTDVECRIVRPDGKVRFIHVRGEVHRDATGHLLSMAGTVLDITDRKQNEEALRASEERWQLAVRGSNDGIWDWNIQTGDVFFSSRWKAMRGFEDHEITNHVDEWRSRIHPDDLDRVLQNVDAYFAKQIPEFCEEYRVQRKDGSYMRVLDRGMALWADDGTPLRMAGSESDITKRKQTEEALAQSEQQMRTVLDALPVGVWFTDRSGKPLFANPAAKQIWSNIKQIGLQTSDNQSSWWETIGPANEPHRWALSQVLTTGVPSLNETFDLECLDGTKKVIRNSTVPVQSEAGTILGAIVLNEDITMLRQAQAALQLTQFSVDHAVEGFFWIGSDARIFHVNDSACRMLGYTWEELTTMTLHDLDPNFPPEAWPVHWEELREKGSLTFESKLWSRTGRVLDTEVTVNYLQYEGREYNCAIMRDIGERKRADTSLRASEERYRSLYDETPTMYFTLATDGTVRSVNRFGAEQLGYQVEELIGHSVLSLFHEGDEEAVTASLSECLATPEIMRHWEFRKVRKDGSMLWVQETVRVGQSATEETVLLVTCEDITERKRTEEALRQSEERFRTMFTQAPIGMALINSLTRQIYEVNTKNAQLAGRTTEEMRSLDWKNITHPDDVQADLDNMARLNAGEIAGFQMEKRYVRPDGTVAWINLTVAPIQVEEHGDPRHFAMIEDITDRKRTEEALREMNLALANAMPGIARLGPDGRYRSINEVYAGALGYDPSELIGGDWSRTVHPDDRPKAEAAYATMLREGKGEFEAVALRKDSSTFWKQVLMVKILDREGRHLGHHCFMRDITERKQAEETILESQYRLQAIVEGTSDAVFMKDVKGRYLLFNSSAARFVGKSSEEVIGHDDTFVFSHGDAQALMEQDHAVMVDRQVKTYEEHITTADGLRRTFMSTKGPLFDSDGEVIGLFGVARDITERYQAEELIREAELRYRTIFEQAGAGVAQIDSHTGRFVQVNRRYCEIVGLTETEMLATSFESITHPDDLQVDLDNMARLLCGEIPSFIMEKRYLRKDGSIVWVNLNAAPLWRPGEKPTHHIAIVEDITERKQAEEALALSEERYRSLVNNAPIGIFVNEAGRFVYANREFQRIVNAKRAEQLLGMPVMDRIAPEFQPLHEVVQDLSGTIMDNEQPVPSLDEQYVRLDGSRVNVAVTAIPTSLNGTPVMQVLVLDITERKRAEEALAQLNATLEQQVDDRTEALRDSEERLKQAVDVADLGIFEHDHLTDMIDFSPKLREMFDWGSESPITLHEIIARVFPLDREDLGAAISRGHDPAGDGSLVCEHRVVWPDGSIHWLSVRAQTWFIGEGRDRHPMRTVGAVRDITERKRTEEALANVNSRLEQEVAHRTKELLLSEQAIRTLHEATAALGLSFNERMQAVLEVGCRRFKLPIAMLTRVVGEKLEFTHVSAPGTSFTADMAVPLGTTYCNTTLQAVDPVGFEHAGVSAWQNHPGYKTLGLECYLGAKVIGRDRVYGTLCFLGQDPYPAPFSQADKDFIRLMARWISGELDRQQAEQALKQSEERYRVLYDETPTMYFTLAMDGTVRSVNRFGAEQLGYRVEELIGDSVLGLFHEQDKEAVAASLSECLATPEIMRHWEFRKVRKDGSMLWVRETARVSQSSTGETIVLVTCEDITDRKRAEEELRKSHAFIRQVIDTNPNFIFAKDRDGRFTLVNKAVADAYGTTVDELVSKTDADFNPNQEEVAFFRRKDLEVLDSLQDLFISEEVITDSKGRTRWLQTVKRPILDDEGRATMVLGAATDITERKRMEEALRQRERDLHAAIEERKRISQDLHDGILQSLFAIGLTLEVSKSMMPPNARKTSGAPLNRAIDQLNRVMDEIRNFIAGLGSDLFQGEDLPTALQHMLESLTENQATRVRLAVEDRAAKAVSVEQALHLLLVIKEAVSNCIRHGHAQEARVSLKMLKQGVRLSIRDNGCGFNPEAATGTGHGLVNMAARAKKIGGRFTVLSKVNEGTSIVLDLPNEAADVSR